MRKEAKTGGSPIERLSKQAISALIGFILGLLAYPLTALAITEPESHEVIHTPGTALEANRGIDIEPDTSGARIAVPDRSGISASPEAIQRLVETEFGVGHVMVEIARCESSLRQYEGGKVLMGGGGGNYIGIFQIGRQWVNKAASLGFDVYTPEGNVGFAKWLYNAEIVERGQPLWRQWECALYI